MKQVDIESIAFDVVARFDEQEVRKLIEAIEEAPDAFIHAMERLLADL